MIGIGRRECEGAGNERCASLLTGRVVDRRLAACLYRVLAAAFDRRGKNGADQGCGHDRRDSRQPACGVRAGGGIATDRRQLADGISCADAGIGTATDGHHGAANRIEQRQQHAGEKHGGGFCGGDAAAVQPPGYKMDMTVSSAGDARSLEGGILLMTPLYGPDGQIYAQAQGALVLGGYMATGGGNARSR